MKLNLKETLHVPTMSSLGTTYNVLGLLLVFIWLFGAFQMTRTN